MVPVPESVFKNRPLCHALIDSSVGFGVGYLLSYLVTRISPIAGGVFGAVTCLARRVLGEINSSFDPDKNGITAHIITHITASVLAAGLTHLLGMYLTIPSILLLSGAVFATALLLQGVKYLLKDYMVAV